MVSEDIKIYISHLTKCFCVLVEARFLRVNFKIALSEEHDKFLKNEEQIYKKQYVYWRNAESIDFGHLMPKLFMEQNRLNVIIEIPHL